MNWKFWKRPPRTVFIYAVAFTFVSSGAAFAASAWK